MNKNAKFIFTFIISLIMGFFIVGYVRNTMFVEIHWLQSATIWDRFREYYIRTFSLNLIPALIVASLSTLFVGFIKNSRM